MNIGWPVLSKRRTAVLRLCGQFSGGPMGDSRQSLVRMRAPISPPPAMKSSRGLRVGASIGAADSGMFPSILDARACGTPTRKWGASLVRLAAVGLDLGADRLALQPALPRTVGGLGRPADRLHLRGFLDDLFQPRERLRLVLLLAARGLRLDDEDAFFRHPATR